MHTIIHIARQNNLIQFVSCVQNNKNDFAIKLLLKKIAESLTKPLSFTRLANIVKSSGTSLGKQTVINYVGYMTDSYLIFPLANYAAKLVEKNGVTRISRYSGFYFILYLIGTATSVI